MCNVLGQQPACMRGHVIVSGIQYGLGYTIRAEGCIGLGHHSAIPATSSLACKQEGNFEVIYPQLVSSCFNRKCTTLFSDIHVSRHLLLCLHRFRRSIHCSILAQHTTLKTELGTTNVEYTTAQCMVSTLSGRTQQRPAKSWNGAKPQAQDTAITHHKRQIPQNISVYLPLRFRRAVFAAAADVYLVGETATDDVIPEHLRRATGRSSCWPMQMQHDPDPWTGCLGTQLSLKLSLPVPTCRAVLCMCMQSLESDHRLSRPSNQGYYSRIV